MLCDSDSDGDGMTNGAELGDPDCDWVKGQTPKRTENITHPGKITPFQPPKMEERDNLEIRLECCSTDSGKIRSANQCQCNYPMNQTYSRLNNVPWYG